MTTTATPVSFGSLLANRLGQRAQREHWRHDVAAWAQDRLGVHLWSRQVEIAESVARNRRTAVQSAAGIGKSYLAAIIALWWVDVHPPGEAIVVTTAPTAEQVDAILWEEMRKHHRAGGLPGHVQRSKPARWVLDDGTLVGLGRKPADHSSSAFQGIHRRFVLVILDEAGGLMENLWVGAEAITTNEHCRILAIGNPDVAISHFATVCSGNTDLWAHFKISALESPNVTGEQVPAELREVLPSRDQIEAMRIMWGENNPVYRSKVLGEFADNEDALIPLSWITLSSQRWARWQEEREAAGVRIEPPGVRTYAVDIARFGRDKTAITARQGDIVNPDGEPEIETHARLDSIAVAGIVAAKLNGHPNSRAVIDMGGGHGNGVYDILARDGYEVIPYNGSKSTKRKDRTGSWKFNNVRAASYWNVRELLDPAAAPEFAVPPDRNLHAELAAPTFEPRAGGVIALEDKDSTADRIGGSPDRADSLVMSAWSDGPDRGADRQPPPQRARRGSLDHQDMYVDDDPAPLPVGEIGAMPDDEVWL